MSRRRSIPRSQAAAKSSKHDGSARATKKAYATKTGRTKAPAKKRAASVVDRRVKSVKNMPVKSANVTSAKKSTARTGRITTGGRTVREPGKKAARPAALTSAPANRKAYKYGAQVFISARPARANVSHISRRTILVTTQPLAAAKAFRAALQQQLPRDADPETTAVTMPFKITIEFPNRSLEAIAQDVLRHPPSVDITPYVTRTIHPLEIVFYGRYPSGAIGGISGDVEYANGHYTLTLIDPNDLLDYDVVREGELPPSASMYVIGIEPSAENSH